MGDRQVASLTKGLTICKKSNPGSAGITKPLYDLLFVRVS
jgi:hypothetical protein